MLWLMSKSWIAGLVAVLALTLAGCGSDTKSGGADPSTPLGQMQNAVSGDADGVTVTKQAGGYAIDFKIQDNLSNGMIRDGIAVDVFKMLQSISQHGPAGSYSLNFRGTFGMQDKYGQAISPDPVVFRTTFKSGTARRIGYDSINTASYDTVSQLADGMTWIHPAFQ
jgi:hypothetical protein